MSVMRTTVTAILVAQHGGEWLDQTLASLRSQTRQPDQILAIVNGASQSVAQQISASGITHIITAQGVSSFGSSVARALATLPAPAASSAQSEWLWLLSEDASPEPSALEHILTTVQRSPSVAIAGPKLVNWDHPERIIEMGQSLTVNGDRWLLRRQELDQQQYDHLDDVLGVGPVGMLVRRDVWQQLDGFDESLPVYDDGLDLSVRARLAGYRVVVAPSSRVRFAQLGVAGPRVDRSQRVIRRMHAQGRVSQLHRKIAYAPAPLAILMWLLLPLVALGRVAWALVREHPGFMLGEFLSAFRVFFRPDKIIASRKRIRSEQKVAWASLRTLQVDAKTVRTSQMIDREAILASQGRLRRELHFVSSGGIAVVSVAAVLGVVLTWWALGSTSLIGAALAPLSSIGEVWQQTHTIGGVPADPFTWVLAILGSLTFWNPSLAIVILLVLAMPLAALGGWIWAAQLSESPAARALVGMGWAVSPVLLGALDSGRLPAIILAIFLPWLLLAATRSRESWSWSGTASLLAAVALACAPILIPAALLFLVIGVCTTVRGIARVLSIALAPLVLFAPKIIALFGDDPLTLFLDPGITAVTTGAEPWHLVLGFADGGLNAWASIFADLGWSGFPISVLTGFLLVPVAVLAVLGAVTGNIRTTLLHAAMGGAGFLTAVAAGQVALLHQSDEAISLWPGSGVLLFWIALLGLAAVGVRVLSRAAVPVVALAIAGMCILSGPVAWNLVTAQGSVRDAAQQAPAIVQAAGAVDPNQRTIVIEARDSYQLRATEVVGSGVRLDALRTVTQSTTAGDSDRELAEIVGQLTSTGNTEELIADLSDRGVKFVLLVDEGDRQERAYLQAVFDQQPALTNAGDTEQGALWRVTGSENLAAVADAANLNAELEGTALSSQLLWGAQVLLLLALLLLALPTGEVYERAAKRSASPRKRQKQTSAVSNSTESTPAVVQATDAAQKTVLSGEQPEVSTQGEAQ